MKVTINDSPNEQKSPNGQKVYYNMMNTHKQINLFAKATWLLDVLMKKHVPIRADGFPDLSGMDYVRYFPSGMEVWPYEKRRQAMNKRKTLLVFYEGDRYLYNYLNRLDEVVCEAQKYFAVAGFDVSSCVNDAIEEQQMALLVNALVNAYMMLNGVQVVPSLRTGNLSTVQYLRIYPADIAFVVGVLGCHKGEGPVDKILFQLKLLMVRPSHLAVYGAINARDGEWLDCCGIQYVAHDDYRTRSFALSAGKVA